MQVDFYVVVLGNIDLCICPSVHRGGGGGGVKLKNAQNVMGSPKMH